MTFDNEEDVRKIIMRDIETIREIKRKMGDNQRKNYWNDLK